MKLKQISIPIENSPERIHGFTRTLGERGVNLRAMNLVDTGDFGELRILVSDVASARQILMEKGIAARVDNVVAVEIEDQPGQFSNLLGLLLESGITITYAYACAGLNSGKAVMVFRFSDNDRAIKALQDNAVRILDFQSFGITQAAA
jgi:hypothetical protein